MSTTRGLAWSEHSFPSSPQPSLTTHLQGATVSIVDQEVHTNNMYSLAFGLFCAVVCMCDVHIVASHGTLFIFMSVHCSIEWINLTCVRQPLYSGQVSGSLPAFCCYVLSALYNVEQTCTFNTCVPSRGMLGHVIRL